MIDPDIIKRSIFVERWLEETIRKFELLYPGIDREELGKILLDIFQQRGNNPKTLLHNNYLRQEVNSDILTMYDWIQTKKPIVAGGGVFFMDQTKKHSPIYTNIKKKKADRKFYQNSRDTYDPESYEWWHDDMMQTEKKVKINAIYGSFGTPSFQFYNLYTASATTLTSQRMIAVTGIAIEAFLTNSPVFENLDEVLYFFDAVINREEHHINYTDLPTISDWRVVFERYYVKLVKNRDQEETHKAIMEEILRNCTEEQLTRLYYKNNLYAFFDTPLIHGLIEDIFLDDTPFLNPNDIPESIKPRINLIWDYCNEFVFWNHFWTERVRRLSTQTRECVIGVDTDSNMVHLQPFVDYMANMFWEKAASTNTDDDLIFKSANIATVLLTFMIRGALNVHTDACNVLPEEAKDINMKNEYLWARCLWTDVKKRYVTRVLLKDGKRIKLGAKNELDIKGFDFKKAAVNKQIANALAEIILLHIMRPKAINISDVLRELDRIECEIIDSIQKGERTYCLRFNCKEPRAYAKPESQGAVISVQLWNLLYPQNPIQIPTKCDVVILRGVKMAELETMRDQYPEEVSKIERYIFHGPSAAYYEKHGLKYLALPNDSSKVPEFFIPLIDVNKTLTRNLGTFDSIMQSLGVPMDKLKKGSTTYKYYSNIIQI